MPSAGVSPMVCTRTSSSIVTLSIAPCAPRMPWRICAPSQRGARRGRAGEQALARAQQDLAVGADVDGHA